MLLCVAVSAGWLAPLGVREASGDVPAFRVIVHAQNRATGASREFVTNALLKRSTRWDDGEHLYPVDLPVSSGTRRHFSETVLGRSVAAVRKYWQQQIFSGRGLPPPELDSDAAVVRYVAKHRGGLGYVGPDVELSGVKVLIVK